MTIVGLTGVLILAFGSFAGRLGSLGTAGFFLVEGLMLATLLGLGAASTAQRRQRLADGWLDYSGPSPILVLGAWLALSTGLSLALVAAAGVWNPHYSGALAVLVSLAINLACFVGLVWWLVVRPGSISWNDMAHPLQLAPDASDLSFSWTTYQWTGPSRIRDRGALMRDVLLGLGLAIPLLILTNILALILEQILDIEGASSSQGLPIYPGGMNLLIIVLGLAAIAPIGEEIFFRGFAANAWGRSLTRGNAIFRAAGLFAFIHVIDVIGAPLNDGLLIRLSIWAIAVRIPVAWALTWLYMRQRSIYASMTLHGAYNGAIVLVAWWALN